MEYFSFEFFKESQRFVYFAGRFNKAVQQAVVTAETKELVGEEDETLKAEAPEEVDVVNRDGEEEGGAERSEADKKRRKKIVDALNKLN